MPVASFETFDEAEMHRRVLEAEAREGENPFRFGGASIFFQSSLDGPRLHDWLMDEAIDPPASELRHSDWRTWWNAFAHTWNSHQLAHAWAAFDKVRFFEVVEDSPFTAHVSVELVREQSHRTKNLTIERARLLSVCRRPRNAARGAQPAARRLARWANTVEGLPVPSDVPPFAGVGFLVQRRVVLPPRVYGEHDPPADARVPLALFANRETASEYRDRLAAEARQTINPFVFTEPNTRRQSLSGLGFLLPAPDMTRREEWLEWYDLCQDDATDEQRASAWRLCEPPLFEVLRVEVRDE
jgi:hypothetical protein